MIASHAGVLVGSFFTQNFFSLGFWAIDIILLLAIASVVVILATDDRDPSTVLAWLFVVLLLPVLGPHRLLLHRPELPPRLTAPAQDHGADGRRRRPSRWRR